MDLILWRHAEAEDGHPDDKRRLTEKGRRDARKVGEWLRCHLPEKTRVLVSPAVRTRETATPFTEHFDVAQGVGVGVGVDSILASAAWPNADGTVLVVGHQPTLGRVASYLINGGDTDCKVAKGALWWFKSNGRRHHATLFCVIHPDLLP